MKLQVLVAVKEGIAQGKQIEIQINEKKSNLYVDII